VNNIVHPLFLKQVIQFRQSKSGIYCLLIPAVYIDCYISERVHYIRHSQCHGFLKV